MSVSTTTPNRLLKKAHLRRWNAQALAAAYLEYASLGLPRIPPCIWTFLSSLGENGFFSSLLSAVPRDSHPFVRA